MKVYLVLVIFIFSSCNILKTLTGGETKVDDEFFQNFDGPEHGFFFIAKASGGVSVLESRSNAITQLTPASSGKEFVNVDKRIYFTGFDTGTNLYRWSRNTNTAIQISGITDPAKLTSFHGRLYLLHENGAPDNLYSVENSANAAAMVGSGGAFDITNTAWLLGDFYHDKLILCADSSGDRVFEINKDDATSGGGGSSCNANGSDRPFYKDGFIMDCFSQFVNRYNTDTLSTDSYDFGTGPSLEPVQMGGMGNFFFQDTSSAPGKLYFVDTTADSLEPILVSDEYDPSNTVLIESPDEVFFVDGNGSGDQIFEFDKNSESLVGAITNFTGKNIFYLGAAGGGFYIFSSDGIEFMDFETKELTLISSITFSASDEFKFYRENDL